MDRATGMLPGRNAVPEPNAAGSRSRRAHALLAGALMTMACLPGSAADLVGALIGGAIGSQVGQGRGQIAATAAGAYLGSKAGDSLRDPNAPGVTGGNLTGALVGGAIGSQFGGGNGRLAATAAGAVIGSEVADRLDERPAPRTHRRPARAPRADRQAAWDYPPPAGPYGPQVQYLTSEPGGAVVVHGSGY